MRQRKSAKTQPTDSTAEHFRKGVAFMKISDLLICRGSERILTRDRKKFADGLASSSYAFPDWLVAKDAPEEALVLLTLKSTGRRAFLAQETRKASLRLAPKFAVKLKKRTSGKGWLTIGVVVKRLLCRNFWASLP
jgi:hypothetical protein